jgi:hypothetical protein
MHQKTDRVLCYPESSHIAVGPGFRQEGTDLPPERFREPAQHVEVRLLKLTGSQVPNPA